MTLHVGAAPCQLTSSVVSTPSPNGAGLLRPVNTVKPKSFLQTKDVSVIYRVYSLENKIS